MRMIYLDNKTIHVDNNSCLCLLCFWHYCIVFLSIYNL